MSDSDPTTDAPDDDPPPPPIPESTARTFLKDRTDLRVAEDAVELFVSHFTAIAEAVATRAGNLATEEERTTMLERDVDTAFNEFLQAGPQVIGPDAIHSAIDTISNQGMGQLIQLLRADLAPPP